MILDLFQPLPSRMRMLDFVKSQLTVFDYRGDGIRELVDQIPAELFSLSLWFLIRVVVNWLLVRVIVLRQKPTPASGLRQRPTISIACPSGSRTRNPLVNLSCCV